jgi:glutamate racemase
MTKISPPTTTPTGNAQPIGVFDSGIGGLSVLRHIRECLPHEDLLYFADSGFAPYGGKPEADIITRTLAIASFLVHQQHAKALVVACNTATAASIKALREHYPNLPVVGVEPGLKPAAARTKSHTVGVLATERTLSSSKFNQLREQITAATGVKFITQACIGLADQIEKGELQSNATALLLRRYLTPLYEQGADTIVLGCTHYPFVHPLIESIWQQLTQQSIALIDTGEAVARQLERLVNHHAIKNVSQMKGQLQGFTSGSKTSLESAFTLLLKMQAASVNVRVVASTP